MSPGGGAFPFRESATTVNEELRPAATNGMVGQQELARQDYGEGEGPQLKLEN